MLIVILCVTLVLTVSIGQHHGTRRLTRGFLVSIGAKLTRTITTGITDAQCAGYGKMLKNRLILGKFGGIPCL